MYGYAMDSWTKVMHSCLEDSLKAELLNEKKCSQIVKRGTKISFISRCVKRGLSPSVIIEPYFFLLEIGLEEVRW